MPIDYDDIIVTEKHRPINPAAVKRLAESIDKVGLRHPITVRKKHGFDALNPKYLLVAGRHRMEACRKLGKPGVMATIVSMTNNEARMWEIAENLHRAELTKLERDEQIAEWIKLSEVLSQTATKPQGGRPESGVRAASRELGIDKDDAHRAVKVASLSDEAKEAAIDVGVDNNRSALLAAAKEKTAEAQVRKIVSFSQAKVNQAMDDDEVSVKWRRSFEKVWNKASAADREWARSWIDQPIMAEKWA